MNAPPRAVDMGIMSCHVCRLVTAYTDDKHAHCPRCGSPLHGRKHASVSRSWALLLAAAMFYIPANIFPIMRTQSLSSKDDNTILSGIIELWRAGSPGLAVIVFTASIIVPMLKFIIMGYLLVSVQRSSDMVARQRSKLYRFVELIGYWSMLDVFVVAILSALVHFKILSRVEPLPGVVYFGIVVVLTMLAAMSFDPRLIWDKRKSQ
ncbi:MAG: paraquat-inducible protein A [Luteibacter sp.]|uniref:paraquat-inducible protein A n=1 Tax=Luteibacter TaxID=242605 RepID=UPI00055EE495|nr:MULTISPECIES: paraquat-inducible protein A [unclassified Luteibacter]MDQ7998177.1 paraquat-inducible protein A [Luteibacter sp.]MDQ8049969.1 paraquat-inducible protein A [Luteibacter sp.]MDR6644677.1 paraquat-inducible protein A [Luteibacter sp. 1214]SKB41622.1 paraquat-inducible protein A [Luteibacter sp. 22Crub2.1]